MFFYYLLPTGLQQLTYLVEHTQDITVDDNDDLNFDPTAPMLEDESPYPEVRSAVANTDNPTMPSSTFRAWVLGLIWAWPHSWREPVLLLQIPFGHHQSGL
jgi:hypothetical protein